MSHIHARLDMSHIHAHEWVTSDVFTRTTNVMKSCHTYMRMDESLQMCMNQSCRRIQMYESFLWVISHMPAIPRPNTHMIPRPNTWMRLVTYIHALQICLRICSDVLANPHTLTQSLMITATCTCVLKCIHIKMYHGYICQHTQIYLSTTSHNHPDDYWHMHIWTYVYISICINTCTYTQIYWCTLTQKNAQM